MKKGHFEDLTKAYLFLTKVQNAILNQNIETEGIFDRYEHDPDFAPIFDYKRDIVKVVHELRIALRPMILAVSGATELARVIRLAGEEAGYVYPEGPQEVKMMGPTATLDYLTPSSASFPPLPDLQEPGDGVALDQLCASMVQATHEENMATLARYHEEMQQLFAKLYDGASTASRKIDNCLQFSLELLGHVDGSLVDLVKNKLLSLFKGRAKSEYLITFTSRVG